MEEGKSYCFVYKGTTIPLEELGKDSEDATINEFNSLILDLNLNYSFAKLLHLSEEEWVNYPISFYYKGKLITLREFVNENQKLSNELRLLESINGLEKNHQLSMLTNRINGKCDKETVAVCTETFRLFQDVYNTFALARFSLLEGFRKLHLYSTLKWDSGAPGQYWIRTSYLNNAIIWYNSCFDILLQTMWIGKKYYINKKINKKNLQFEDLWLRFDEVLARCREADIPETCIKSFSDTSTVKHVRGLANKLKHRNGLRYEEFCDPNLIMYDFGDYNSRQTESSTNIEEVISELISYHKAFITLVDEVKKIVSKEFKGNYNIII